MPSGTPWDDAVKRLQWVRRPRTPVMFIPFECFGDLFGLQWVRRPRTPVMVTLATVGPPVQINASMGPTSENAGYVEHGRDRRKVGDASMGPTSENAGYGRPLLQQRFRAVLQWVRRPRTPVMSNPGSFQIDEIFMLQWVRRPRTPVMMIPVPSDFRSIVRSFNGSDVRERRL